MNNIYRIIFASSLLLNTLLIGIIGGYVAHRLLTPPPKPIWETKAGLMSNLPEEKAKLINDMFRKTYDQHRQMQQLLRQQHKKIFHILTAPTFDAERYDEATLSLHQLHGERINQMRSATKSIAAELDQSQRVQFAEFLQSISNAKPKSYLRK